MDIYARLTYDEYKALEKACKDFQERVHTTVSGYYHKSFRLTFGDTTIEFHGPAVKAGEHD